MRSVQSGPHVGSAAFKSSRSTFKRPWRSGCKFFGLQNPAYPCKWYAGRHAERAGTAGLHATLEGDQPAGSRTCAGSGPRSTATLFLRRATEPGACRAARLASGATGPGPGRRRPHTTAGASHTVRWRVPAVQHSTVLLLARFSAKTPCAVRKLKLASITHLCTSTAQHFSQTAQALCLLYLLRTGLAEYGQVCRHCVISRRLTSSGCSCTAILSAGLNVAALAATALRARRAELRLLCTRCCG